jgi:hypothetical protein
LTGSEHVQPGGLDPLQDGQVVAGIDWARDDHAVAVVDDRGRVV